MKPIASIVALTIAVSLLCAGDRCHGQSAGSAESVAADLDLQSLDFPRLLEQLQSRNPAVREAVLGHIQRQPDLRPQVVETLDAKPLAARLAMLELLERWKAPVEGIDPWRPETLDDARRAALVDWASKSLETPPAAELTEEQLAAARREIDRMLAAPSDESAAAMREHLSHFRAALLPEVVERLAEAQDDRQRQRLAALLYRLVSEIGREHV